MANMNYVVIGKREKEQAGIQKRCCVEEEGVGKNHKTQGPLLSGGIREIGRKSPPFFPMKEKKCTKNKNHRMNERQSRNGAEEIEK